MPEDLNTKVMRHEFELKSVHESLTRSEATVMNLREDVDNVKDHQTKMDAAAEAIEKAARNAVTAKQLYMTAAGVCVALGSFIAALIAATGH